MLKYVEQKKNTVKIQYKKHLYSTVKGRAFKQFIDFVM